MEIAEGQKYLKTYWVIEKRKDLKAGEKHILQLLLSFTTQGTDCYVSEDTIAQLFGVSRATITRGKRLLLDKGLIKVTSRYVNKEKKTVFELQVRRLNDYLGFQFLITNETVPTPVPVQMHKETKNKSRKKLN